MSHFIDAQAEESSDESELSDSEPAAKRSKKQKRKQIRSDDEEDDEDEVDDDARLKEEMRGFVVDEDDDVGGNSDDDEEGDDDQDKSDRGASDIDDLLEDDLELVNENIGRKVVGRVEISDDEEDDRERIKGDLFGHDELDGGDVREPQDIYGDDDSRSESEQSEDPFIVQDDGMEKRRRHHKGRRSGFNDQFLDEAKDIFGVEDIDEFYEDDDGLEDEGEEGEEGGVSSKPKSVKVSLWNTIEPSELAKGFVSAADKRIIFEDRPERFQMRRISVTEVDESELDAEKQWIYNYAFGIKPLTKQDVFGLAAAASSDNFSARDEADQEAPKKIGEALHFIRNQVYEVPFIAFYRKEHVESILMRDLWKIYQYDEKWCRLQQRKKRINDLLKRMEQFIMAAEPEEVAHVRKISEVDFVTIDGVQNSEQLSDVYAHFQLYYGNEMKRVQEWEQKTLEKERGDTSFAPKFKLGARTDKYLLCIQCGLGPLAEEFGLTPTEFAENFTDYVKNEIRQSPIPPKDLAKEYINDNFPNEDDVLKGATYVLAQQFSREPAVRKKLREQFCERLMISVHPTKKGLSEIDENHPMWGKHYILNKPVGELLDDEYLKYYRAKNDGLLEIRLYADKDEDIAAERTLLDVCLFKEEIFHRDEFHYVVDEWNKLRKEVLKICVNELLIPVFEREAHEKLLDESYECVLRKCSEKLADRLATESYKPTFRYVNDDEEEGDNGVRVMALCYSPDQAEASFALVIDQDGVVLEHQRLVNLTKRENSRFPGEAQLKANDLETLKKFIIRRQPHIIGINGEDLGAMRLQQDITSLIKKMLDQGDLQFEIPVEITDNETAKVYMNSQMATQEFSEYPPLLRQCVSLARYILDPLIEVCHLCNSDDDILFMKFHSLQGEVPKRELLFNLHMECINRVNEVGVDINRCLEFPHTAFLLQFVCGLGPRKASHLLKILKQNDNLLESRTKLVTFCRMGPKVFMNASGFIKIETAKVSERTDAYVEVLDGSRVHPETYEWARKMAVDALEIDDPPDPTAALEEILQCPDRLRDLDLDAFAEELSRQGFGNKSITLYDIRAELNYRYKDLRSPHKAPDSQELYEMLMRDGDSCSEGKLVSGRILHVVYKQPGEKEYQNRKENIYNQSRNTWECDFCKRADFADVSEVWTHTEKKIRQVKTPNGEEWRPECPGIPVGAKVRLDNGFMGFVSKKNISDNAESAKNPTERLVPGKDQMFRVLKFDVDKMSAELSCKSSDLQRYQEKTTDRYFDHIRCADDKEQREKALSAQTVRNNFVKRVISHPSFHNVTFKDAERMLRNMEPGEVVVRPSAKAVNYLTVTWKVCKDIYQHINIRESQKDKVYDIGKALFINAEQFEDLDEIIARHIQPMAGFAQDIMSYKYFMSDVYAEEVSTIETFLHSEKRNAPKRIPYAITPSSKYPGKFVLSYLIMQKVRHEYLSSTPEGIKFRFQYFNTTEELINWFKNNFTRRPDAFRK